MLSKSLIQFSVYGWSCVPSLLFTWGQTMVGTSLVAQRFKPLSTMWETCIRPMGLEDPLEKEMAIHSSTIAWKTPGWKSVVGYSPWGRKELDTTERLHFHFLLSCIGEGSGKPLQCSCLENPRDGRAWWAAVSGSDLAAANIQYVPGMV